MTRVIEDTILIWERSCSAVVFDPDIRLKFSSVPSINFTMICLDLIKICLTS